jgi:hypothetical protein
MIKGHVDGKTAANAATGAQQQGSAANVPTGGQRKQAPSATAAKVPHGAPKQAPADKVVRGSQQLSSAATMASTSQQKPGVQRQQSTPAPAADAAQGGKQRAQPSAASTPAATTDQRRPRLNVVKPGDKQHGQNAETAERQRTTPVLSTKVLNVQSQRPAARATDEEPEQQHAERSTPNLTIVRKSERTGDAKPEVQLGRSEATTSRQLDRSAGQQGMPQAGQLQQVLQAKPQTTQAIVQAPYQPSESSTTGTTAQMLSWQMKAIMQLTSEMHKYRAEEQERVSTREQKWKELHAEAEAEAEAKALRELHEAESRNEKWEQELQRLKSYSNYSTSSYVSSTDDNMKSSGEQRSDRSRTGEKSLERAKQRRSEERRQEQTNRRCKKHKSSSQDNRQPSDLPRIRSKGDRG